MARWEILYTDPSKLETLTKADLEEIDVCGFNALMRSARGDFGSFSQSRGQIKYMLKVGVDINTRRIAPQTDIMRLLNSATNIGQTALHWAAEQGNYEAAKTLVARGIDVSITSARGKTALDYAIESKLAMWLNRQPRNHQKIIELLSRSN